MESIIRSIEDNIIHVDIKSVYGVLSKQKEWICSLFKEWILEKSEIRVKFWSDQRDHSGILNDHWGHSKMS